ncbi:bifunctional metallophosphatase/5'-nucleotidase [Brevibacillus sp. TJ4]|uniref:bifunctional metallophosphatase/5'-nucleotidase n=1 Tax=Brevibacillus sp. TJ4 TaxID=3234853 RepID=UPI003BA0DDF9
MAATCTLHLLHTNDVHSQFASVPRIATCLRTSRENWEAQGEHVLTCDIGDHLDRMNIMTEAGFGQVNVQVMNRSGYQYATIGNNEGVTLPKEKLDRLYGQARFSVIVGNLRDGTDGSRPAWALPYAIHAFPELKVALLGMTVPYPDTYEGLGWIVDDPIPLLRRQIADLQGRADVIVLLSHLGYMEDCRLARELEGIDVILGAHTHHVLDTGERIGNTLIAQTGRFGQYIGHVRLVWNQESLRIEQAEAELLPAEQYQPDAALSAFLQEEEQKARRTLTQTIASIPRDLPVRWDEESPLGSFLAASIREKTGAEIGLANAGLLLSDLKRGSLSYADLLHCLPHPINLCAVTLSGAQLTELLQQAIQPEIVGLKLRGYGFRGKVEGWMAVDGLRVTYIGGDKPTIAAVEVNGSPLDRKREYRVGTVDMFLYNRLFPQLVAGRDPEYFLSAMLREIIAESILDERMLENSFSPRWIALPAEQH